MAQIVHLMGLEMWMGLEMRAGSGMKHARLAHGGHLFTQSDATFEEAMQKTSDVAQLAAITKRMRRTAIEMITEAGSGHPGGSLSAAEIVTTLFFDVLRHDPDNPHWPDRDRFILSKGHCCPILYAVMAECGYCPKDKLMTLRKLGSIYQGHPDVRFLPALEASTGSLGLGLSLGLGMSLAARLNKGKPGGKSRSYVVLGDGEIQEGQIWEAAMAAAWDEYAVRVDCGQSFGRAKTIPGEGVGENEKAWAGRTAVRILTGADSRRLVELELSRLAE